MGPRKDLAALAGIVAPVVFGFGIVALTVAQYDYMTGLGWRPFDDSSGVPWLDRCDGPPALRPHGGRAGRTSRAGKLTEKTAGGGKTWRRRGTP